MDIRGWGCNRQMRTDWALGLHTPLVGPKQSSYLGIGLILSMRARYTTSTAEKHRFLAHLEITQKMSKIIGLHEKIRILPVSEWICTKIRSN